jgi:carbamoyl-phosphate synthase small subunit
LIIRGEFEKERRALLVLEDGSSFQGVGFGAVGKISGEIVFNTGMVGYTEAITDPSYHGQILMQTYPLIGNYGVCTSHFESDGPKIQGYIIRELCREPSHWTSEITLDDWLTRNKIPGIERIDTRLLTKKIRTEGTMLGILQVYDKSDEPNLDELIEEIDHVPDPNERTLAYEVSTDQIKRLDADSSLDVVLVDYGVKRSIIRNLIERGMNVIVVPPKTKTEEILNLNPEAVILSNGPGDPKIYNETIREVEKLINSSIPILGICLGNQILTLALGGNTYKLHFGHRGHNHPCIDLNTGRCYITSQNHGYAVDRDSLEDTGLKTTFINANDKTVEGVSNKENNVYGVQFHPEASPGPNDVNHLFDIFFQNLITKGKS